jgi:hypothetical protein
MTLIAAWKENNTPVLIGDLVTSRLGEFDTPHHALPTRKDLDNLLPKEWRRQIVDLCQKAYRVSGTFAVAWCDNRFAAKSVLERLFEKYSDSECSVNEVKSFLATITGYDKLTCTLIGWVVDAEGAHCFRWRSDDPGSFLLSDRFIEGSGSKYFGEIFTPQAKLGENPIEGALGKVAHVLKDEVLYGTNLWQLFGGGFQVIYWNGDEFTVLPSATYIFLQVEETEDIEALGLLQPKRVLKYQYENSIVQTLAVLLDEESVSTHQQEASKLATHEMHYAVPITAEPGDSFEVNSNLSFISDYYCICIDVKCIDGPSNLGDGEFVLLTLVRCVSNKHKDAVIGIAEQSGGVEGLMIKDKLFKDLIRFLEAARRSRMASGC